MNSEMAVKVVQSLLVQEIISEETECNSNLPNPIEPDVHRVTANKGSTIRTLTGRVQNSHTRVWGFLKVAVNHQSTRNNLNFETNVFSTIVGGEL